MTALRALLLRDMRIAIRIGGGAMMAVLFFLVVVVLTPFALGPDMNLLSRVGEMAKKTEAVVENLQEFVQNSRVSLLDFVE